MSSHNLKGFCAINDLINNSDTTTPAIGCLSPKSLTFSRNVQTYSALPPAYTDFELKVFSYKDANKAAINAAAPDNIVTELLTAMNWININSRNGVIGMDVVQFNTDINNALGTEDLVFISSQMFSANIKGINIIVPVKLTVTNTSLDYTLVVWFVNSRFALEYDEYEFAVRSPTTTVDVLTGLEAAVTADIGEWDTDLYNQDIAALANGDPYTKVVTTKLEWHQLSDNRITKTIEFTTIIWGNAGDNQEYIRNNLIKFILANSGHPESDWIIILPDLFIKDEFTIVPRWSEIAIGKEQTMAEVYSPLVKFSSFPSNFKYFPTYSEEHLTTNIEALPLLWQSMCCLVCGGTRNNIHGPSFKDAFGDVILAVPGTLDYNRMSDEAKEALVVINSLIVQALDFTGDSETLPEGVGTVIRNGLIYLQGVVNNVTFIVLTRASYSGQLIA